MEMRWVGLVYSIDGGGCYGGKWILNRNLAPQRSFLWCFQDGCLSIVSHLFGLWCVGINDSISERYYLVNIIWEGHLWGEAVKYSM